MNDDNLLGGVLGQLGQTVKQAVKQVVKIPEEMAQDVGGQVGGEKAQQPDTKLYGKSDDSKKVVSSAQNRQQVQVQSDFEKAIADKTPEEQQKLRQLRKILHEQYYDQLTNPAKKQEERPAEKVENEKKQEMQDLQKKEEKKPPPLAITRNQERVEKFPGASG